MVERFEEPLFKSARGALLFAYNFSHGSVKKPFLASLMVGGRRTGKGLAGLDGAAQAGMIKAEVSAMSKNAFKRIVVARYSPHKTPCDCGASCCAGYRLNREWAEAVDWLSVEVQAAALAGTVSNYRLRRALVLRYFGEEASMTEVAKQCRVNRDTASEHNRRVGDYLRAGEEAAELEIRDRLYVASIIEG